MARVSENLKNPFDKGEAETPDVKPAEDGGEGVEVKLRDADDDDDDDDESGDDS